jgi:hypothetical protein
MVFVKPNLKPDRGGAHVAGDWSCRSMRFESFGYQDGVPMINKYESARSRPTQRPRIEATILDRCALLSTLKAFFETCSSLPKGPEDVTFASLLEQPETAWLEARSSGGARPSQDRGRRQAS